MIKARKIIGLIGLFLTIVYPFVIYRLLSMSFPIHYLSLYLLLVILVNFCRVRNYILMSIGIFLIFLLLVSEDRLFLKLYPVLMNGTVCALFLVSLNKKPLVTLFAEKMKQEITPKVLRYTYKVTLYWGIFMLFNTIISALTILCSDFIWAIYNGLISYMLISIAFIIEWCFRRRFVNV